MNAPPADKLHAGRVLVPAPRRDRLERAESVAGERRYPAERDRAGAGPVRPRCCCANRGITSIDFLAAVSRASVTADIAAEPTRAARRGRSRGCGRSRSACRKASRCQSGSRHWVDGLLTPAGAESFPDLTRRAVAAINVRFAGHRWCWWWRMARCSGPCAARWGTNRTCGLATPCRCGASRRRTARMCGELPMRTDQIAWHVARQGASCTCPGYPTRERAGQTPPPKAQPAPGNAQAHRTATG